MINGCEKPPGGGFRTCACSPHVTVCILSTISYEGKPEGAAGGQRSVKSSLAPASVNKQGVFPGTAHVGCEGPTGIPAEPVIKKKKKRVQENEESVKNPKLSKNIRSIYISIAKCNLILFDSLTLHAVILASG